MSACNPRRLQFVAVNGRRARSAAYWQGRSHADRLEAVFALHRQGNALFNGGHMPFVFQWKLSDVRTG